MLIGVQKIKAICDLFSLCNTKDDDEHLLELYKICQSIVLSTVKFLSFWTPTNFTVNTLKFILRGSTMV